MLSLAVTVHHQNNSSIIVHIPHYAGHSLHARPLAGMTAAVTRHDFIPTIFPGADNGRGHDTVFLDTVHHFVHFVIVTDLKRVIPKGMQFRQRQNLDFL